MELTAGPYVILGLIALVFATITEAVPAQTTSSPQPVYNPPTVSPVYIPHATYPYADSYGGAPSSYAGYVYPLQNYPSSQQSSSLLPAVQGALTVVLRLFAKLGLYLIGGAALFLVGGIFTTAVCSLTPFCTITFAGLGDIDKESMRSLVTPDRISEAAALVQDAIGKYQTLQKVVG